MHFYPPVKNTYNTYLGIQYISYYKLPQLTDLSHLEIMWLYLHKNHRFTIQSEQFIAMSYFSHFVVFIAGGFVFGFGLCVWFLVFCVCGFCVCLFTFKLYLVGKKKRSKVWFGSSETYENSNSIKWRMLNCQPQKTVFLPFRGHSSQRRFLEGCS